jgi:hypothetical protein
MMPGRLSSWVFSACMCALQAYCLSKVQPLPLDVEFDLQVGSGVRNGGALYQQPDAGCRNNVTQGCTQRVRCELHP